jgi:hypothetical protein
MPEISTGSTERKAETMAKASYSEIMGWETEKRPVLLSVYWSWEDINGNCDARAVSAGGTSRGNA